MQCGVVMGRTGTGGSALEDRRTRAVAGRPEPEELVHGKLPGTKQRHAGRETEPETSERKDDADQRQGQRQGQPGARDMATADDVRDRTEPRGHTNQHEGTREPPACGPKVHARSGLRRGHPTRLYASG